jgi:RND family efflux transporter MFP subunit
LQAIHPATRPLPRRNTIEITIMKSNRCISESIAMTVTIVLSITLLAGGCARQTSTKGEGIRPVKTLVVARGEAAQVRTFPGKVEASQKVELAFQVSGLLDHLPVKEGQKVAKGEIVAQLRQDEFEARLKALRGQLDQARAGLRALRAGERPEQQLRLEAQLRAANAKLANARAEFNRAAMLVQSRALSRADFEVAEATYRVAQEEHEAARQMLEKGTMAREEDIEAKEAEVRGLEGRVVEAKTQLADCTLRAPYDGVIARRFVEEKQSIRAKEPVVKFQDVDEIFVALDVPETLMAADLARADIDQILAEFSGAPGLQFPVQIKEVAQTADPVTQTFKVRAGMQAPPDVRLLPGMTATVTLTYHRAGILGNRILIPISSVYKDATGAQIVWIIGTDQSVARRPVKIGEAIGGNIEIADGLQPGDRIAVAGVPYLREGMKVRDLGDALGGGLP